MMPTSTESFPGPVSLRVTANGLEHHVLEWPARAPDAAATVLLLHGFMDAAATWGLVAPALAAGGYRVIAPDLRGFGDAPRAAAGAYYHFPDYVFDVADVVDALVPAGGPLLVVGHSMGGTIANMFAGTFPERVRRLAILEGAGPPNSPPETAPDRMRRWIEQVRSVRAKGPGGGRRMASRDDAVQRLIANHPRVPQDVLRTHVSALARELGGSEGVGGVAWKADPLHGTTAPTPFLAEVWMAFARRVTCPVLFVSGGPLGWHPPDEEARVASFAVLD
ncbi:MAG: alpha/beta fold hydrolase, partial [Polyangiaceae bacterium]